MPVKPKVNQVSKKKHVKIGLKSLWSLFSLSILQTIDHYYEFIET